MRVLWPTRLPVVGFVWRPEAPRSDENSVVRTTYLLTVCVKHDLYDGHCGSWPHAHQSVYIGRYPRIGRSSNRLHITARVGQGRFEGRAHASVCVRLRFVPGFCREDAICRGEGAPRPHGCVRGSAPVGSARPDGRVGGVRRSGCNMPRMDRALHPRWPYRRSHIRHDLHWLVRVRPRREWCAHGRTHSVATLRSCRRLRRHTN
jgi:hypothetical protein